MNFQTYAIIALPLLITTSILMLLGQKWRVFIFSLAAQYVAVFLLVGLVSPVGTASVKLVVGWMSASILASTQADRDVLESDNLGLSGSLLRLVAALIVMILGFSLAPKLKIWIPASDILVYGGIVLFGMGVVQLGMTKNPLRVIGGLLTLFSGFEILYAVVESSLLVTGLLALINLGLTMIGAYFLNLKSEVEKA